MKNLPQQHSPAKPHEFIRLYLDIGQCRFIHKLLNEKYQLAIANALPDKNEALGQLLDKFEKHAFPAISQPFHKDDSFDAYIDAQDINDLHELASYIYVDGVLSDDLLGPYAITNADMTGFHHEN